jgi:hypothetical protein
LDDLIGKSFGEDKKIGEKVSAPHTSYGLLWINC